MPLVAIRQTARTHQTPVCILAMMAALVLLFASLVIAPGCAPAETSARDREVDEGMAAVTFPDIYFAADAAQDEVVSYLEAQGYQDVEANPDKSYTVTMTQAERDKLVSDLHVRTKGQFDSIPNGQSYPHITTIEYSDSFANVRLVCTTRQLTDEEQGVWKGIGGVAYLYQSVAGIEPSCTITFEDESGKVIKTAAYA